MEKSIDERLERIKQKIEKIQHSEIRDSFCGVERENIAMCMNPFINRIENDVDNIINWI